MKPAKKQSPPPPKKTVAPDTKKIREGIRSILLNTIKKGS